MKKCIKFLMVVLILFTSSNLYATGESCNTPYVVLPDENFAHQNFSVTNSDRTLWFKFEANFSDMLLYTCEISNLSPFTHALAMNLYSGTCSALTELKSQTFEDLPQGERSMTIGNLTIGQTYFLKVTTKGSMANLAAAFINLSSNSAPICVLPNSIVIGPGNVTDVPITTYWNNPMQGTQLNAANYTFTGKNYIVAAGQTLVIDQTSHFVNCNFILWGPTSRILIAIGGDHTFTNCYIGGCYNMYKGIEIGNFDSEGSLTLTDCLIEDAWKAIDVVPYPDRTDYTINIESTIFNKNLYGIIANSSNVFLNVKNSVFTSRNIFTNIQNIPSASTLKPAYPNSNSNLLNFLNFGAFTTNLKFPNNLIPRSKFGIQLANCNNAVFYASNKIGSPQLGSSQYNCFDNLDYGIDVRASVTTIQNNVFSGHDGNFNSNFNNPYSSTGIGVVAWNFSSTANKYDLTLGGVGQSSTNFQPNYFMTLPFAGFFHNVSNLSVLNNTTDNVNYHFLVNPASFGTSLLSYNKLKPSGNYGIKINLSNSLSANVSISNNTINSLTSIEVANSSNGSMNSVSVFKNIILNTAIASNGILFSAVKGLTSHIIENTIGLTRALPTYGIRVLASDHVMVHDNILTGNITSSTPSWTSTNFINGITLQNTTESKVYCNLIANVDRALVFNGNCLNAAGASELVYTNEMRNCYDGLSLENSGRIGQQGAVNSPSDNLWSQSSGWTWNSQTSVDLSSIGSAYSFYVRNNAPGTGYNPSPNNGTININRFSPKVTSGSRSFCAPCIGTNCISTATIATTLRNLLLEEQNFIEPSLEADWLNQKYVLKKLLYEAALDTLTDSLLLTFRDSAHMARLGTVVTIEELMTEQDYTNAQNLLNDFVPTNQMEMNFMIYNNLLSLLQTDPNFTPSGEQILSLKDLADQCYPSGGDAVLQARALLDYFIFKDTTYIDSCANRNASRVMKQSFNPTSNAEEVDFLVALAPNPVKKQVRFAHNQLQVHLCLFNSTGELVFELDQLLSNQDVDLSSLPNGFYCYRLFAENGANAIGKLVISRLE